MAKTIKAKSERSKVDGPPTGGQNWTILKDPGGLDLKWAAIWMKVNGPGG